MAEKNDLPVIFRGQTRFYRVIGVQGETCYGLNVGVTQNSSRDLTLTLAFACLNTPPKGTPFAAREKAKFLVAFEEHPGPDTEPLFHKGYRLDKIEILVGKNLSVFDGTAYVEKQIPALKTWLDQLLENAGIMPTYNDTSEVFKYFFGTSGPGEEYLPLTLPDLGKFTPPEETGTSPVDFSQYGKKELKFDLSKPNTGIPGVMINPATGEVNQMTPEGIAQMLAALGDPSDPTSAAYQIAKQGWEANGGTIDAKGKFIKPDEDPLTGEDEPHDGPGDDE